MIGYIIGGLAVLWAIGEVKKANPPKAATVIVNSLPVVVERNVVTGEAFFNGNDWDPAGNHTPVVSGIPEGALEERNIPKTAPPVN